MEAIQERVARPRLIVIDTLARCFGGLDENSAQDMGQFVAACDRLRKSTGAALLAVHHTGKGGNASTKRGSSALRGAADSMIQVQAKNGTICVAVDKQKDAKRLSEVRLRLREVTFPTLHGGSRTSCVLDPSDDVELEGGPLLLAAARAALKALVDQGASGAASGEWRRAIPRADGEAMPPESFNRYRVSLLRQKLIEEVSGRRHWYRATDFGIATARGIPSGSQFTCSSSAVTPTPPEGGGGGTEESLAVEGLVVTLNEAGDGQSR